MSRRPTARARLRAVVATALLLGVLLAAGPAAAGDGDGGDGFGLNAEVTDRGGEGGPSVIPFLGAGLAFVAVAGTLVWIRIRAATEEDEEPPRPSLHRPTRPSGDPPAPSDRPGPGPG